MTSSAPQPPVAPRLTAPNLSQWLAVFAGSILLMLGMLFYGTELSSYQVMLAVAIVLIGALPIVGFIRQPSGRYPLAQAALLYHGTTFGLVCFSSNISWLGLPVEYIDKALELTLQGMVGLWIGFKLSGLIRIADNDGFSTIPLKRTLNWAAILIGLKLLPYLMPWLKTIPTFQHIAQAGSWVGIALLLTAQLRRELPRLHQTALGSVLLFEATYRLATGFLANLALLFLVISFVIWRERGRIPVLPIALGLATLGILGPVKSEWRARTWQATEQVGTFENLSILADLTENYYFHNGYTARDAAEKNVNRLGYAPTFAWVTYVCPAQVSYWNGYSYNALWFSLVPRFLYPDKPIATIGNEFGRRYLLLAPSDFVTSYNLPWLVEFYANFGELSVLPGMMFCGLLLGIVTVTFGRACSDLHFAIGVATTHQLFFAESNFALMWGNVILSIVFFTVLARLSFKR